MVKFPIKIYTKSTASFIQHGDVRATAGTNRIVGRTKILNLSLLKYCDWLCEKGCW